MTTECSLEGVPCPVFARARIQTNTALCALSGHLYHPPANHKGPQQNVFITGDNVSLVIDNVKKNSIVRGCFHFGGCATEAQCENSHEPSHLYDVVCVAFPRMPSPPTTSFHPPFSYLNI